jgi:23S rRNA (uracil1939-C5)-methyltransferase
MIEGDRSIAYHTVTLGALTREGDAAAEISKLDGDGIEQWKIVRVPAGLPGERVTIAVEAPAKRRPVKRSRRWKARPPRVWIDEIHEASPLRREAHCPVFGVCGGCQLQHMEYAAQLAWKRSVVEQLLRETGEFELPPLLDTVACDDPWHYRNHMRFSVNRGGEVGLTARGTHRVLPLASCPIADEQINLALQVLSQQANERPQVLIRCGSATGQLLIQPHPRTEVLEKLTASGLDLRVETLEEQLAGEIFRIRPSSFFQTNTAQAEKMVQTVVKGLGHARVVVDAYCGVGTFALVLARHIEKVIAIEESASAVKDAQWNLRAVSNVEIIKGKVEDVLPSLAAEIDGLVIDPPRAGCQQVVLDALARHAVARIVYVSCDPTTLARDLHILCHLQQGYHLQSVQPLDMFPHTAHIECVAILERK